MNQESSHSEQDSLATDTVETNQSPKNDQTSENQNQASIEVTLNHLKTPKLN